MRNRYSQHRREEKYQNKSDTMEESMRQRRDREEREKQRERKKETETREQSGRQRTRYGSWQETAPPRIALLLPAAIAERPLSKCVHLPKHTRHDGSENFRRTIQRAEQLKSRKQRKQVHHSAQLITSRYVEQYVATMRRNVGHIRVCGQRLHDRFARFDLAERDKRFAGFVESL